MAANDVKSEGGKSKKKGKRRDAVEERKPLFSDRQRKIFLILIAAMLILVPVADNFRCKAACLKKVKTPYPEIACGYECPWPWQRTR